MPPNAVAQCIEYQITGYPAGVFRRRFMTYKPIHSETAATNLATGGGGVVCLLVVVGGAFLASPGVAAELPRFTTITSIIRGGVL